MKFRLEVSSEYLYVNHYTSCFCKVYSPQFKFEKDDFKNCDKEIKTIIKEYILSFYSDDFYSEWFKYMYNPFREHEDILEQDFFKDRPYFVSKKKAIERCQEIKDFFMSLLDNEVNNEYIEVNI